MEAFDTLTGTAAPLLRDNIDTDAIIPSREMRSVSREGLGDGLFAGWRYRDAAARVPNPDFVLNDPVYAGARILVCGANFGCGSSREHAVWALVEYGIRAVVAPSFNPIFRNNCIANGVVPAILPRDIVEEIAARLGGQTAPTLTVDLIRRHVRLPNGGPWRFEIEAEQREALLAGLDPIQRTLQHEYRIQSFRRCDAQQRPWVYETVIRTQR